jgi:polyisoprenoid-binding protein YceI
VDKHWVFRTAAALGASLFLVQSASSGDAYRIDHTHAWISFSIRHGSWSHYLGMFHSISGLVNFDKTDVTASSVEAEIVTSTIDTSNEERDQGELQTEGFLNGLKYPVITFKSTSIKQTGERQGIITGDLSMAGITVPVALDTTFNDDAYLPATGQQTAGFSATGSLNTNDFGMNGLPPLDIGPVVDFRIEIEAYKCGLTCGEDR